MHTKKKNDTQETCMHAMVMHGHHFEDSALNATSCHHPKYMYTNRQQPSRMRQSRNTSISMTSSDDLLLEKMQGYMFAVSYRSVFVGEVIMQWMWPLVILYFTMVQ